MNSQANTEASRQVVLITGAAGDIGYAAAKVLASPMRIIALADHPGSLVKLKARAEELRGLGFTVVEAPFDVCDRSAVAAAIDRIVDKVGIPTHVFNNAGLQGSFARVDKMETSDIERVLAVNVVGVFNVISVVADRLIAAAVGGCVVNTASMAGVSGAPNMAGYSASKAAVIGLTKSCAKDLAPFGIRVNAISPAFIGPGAMWDRQVELQAAAESPYFSSDPAEVAKQMIGMVPMRRYGTLGEVANVVDFLLSPTSSYLTGVNIEVSGGSA